MIGTKETGSRDGPTRDELQDDLMRFEGRFASRVTAAFRPLTESPSADDPPSRGAGRARVHVFGPRHRGGLRRRRWTCSTW